MADPNLSPNRLLQVPIVSGDNGTWGGFLNFTIDALDSILGTFVPINSSQGNSLTATSSQCQSAGFFTNTALGTFSGAITLTIPASVGGNGLYTIVNGSTTPVTVTQGSSASSVTVPANTNRIVAASGGMGFADSFTAFPLPTAAEIAWKSTATGQQAGLVVPFTLVSTGWSLTCWDSSVPSETVNVLLNGSSIATLNASGTVSGPTSAWSTSTFTAGQTLNPQITALSAGTAFTLSVFGSRSN